MISIITITYNAENVLTPTMKSLSTQTYRDFEHIIVDGASKDNTLQTARNHAGKNLRILSEPDKGLYDAMNKGIDIARGKYLLFLNAGDTFHDKDSLSEYAKAIEKAGNPDIVYADTVLVDANRKIIGPRHLSAPDRLTVQSYKNGMLVCHQAFMVRTELIRLFNIKYDLKWRFSADYEWCLRCISNTSPERCINLNRITIDYLQEGLTTKNHRASLLERYKIMCKYYGTLSTAARHVKFALRNLKRL